MFYDAKIALLLLLDSACQSFVGRGRCVASHSIRDKDGTVILVVSLCERDGDASLSYDVADGINAKSLSYMKSYLKENFLWRAERLLLDRSYTTVYYLLVDEAESAYREVQRRYGEQYEKQYEKELYYQD